MTKEKTKKLQLTAKALGYTLHISFGRPEDVTSTRADDLVDVTTIRHNLPGHICIEIAWGTKKLDVSCTYAPATPLARVEFLRDLRQQKIITPASLAGGGWNCVPDTALDVISANPLGYAGQNQGAKLLEAIMQEMCVLKLYRIVQASAVATRLTARIPGARTRHSHGIRNACARQIRGVMVAAVVDEMRRAPYPQAGP